MGFTVVRSNITGQQITDGSIAAVDLGAGSVTEEKIANGAIGTDKLAQNAVIADKIADGAVTEEKLANSFVSATLNRYSHYGSGSVIPTPFKYWDYTGRHGYATVAANELVEEDALTTLVVPYECTFSGSTYIVNAIGSHGSVDLTNVQTVILPNTITTIGSYAFYNCSSLKTIVIPDSVTSFGEDVFDGCNNDFSIICSQGSAAETYAIENGITCRYNVVNESALSDLQASISALSISAAQDADDLSNEISAISGRISAAEQNITALSAAGSVTEEKIASGAITEGKLGNTSVTESKIAANAVTAAKIASGAVTGAKIASGAVSTAKIASGAITLDKISTELLNELLNFIADFVIEPVIDGVTEKIVIKRYLPAAKYCIYAGDTALSNTPLALNRATVTAAGVFAGNIITARFYDAQDNELGRAALTLVSVSNDTVGRFSLIEDTAAETVPEAEVPENNGGGNEPAENM